MSPRRRCQPAGASNTAAKRQNLPGTEFSRRNCQALHGWGWSNAIAKWQNLPGGEVLSVQLPSPAWLGIVECNCQVAKLARRRGSLGAIAKPCVVGDCRMHPPGGEIFSVQLPAAGLSNAADRRQNLPGGEVLSCYCQTMRERQMQPTGGKTCQAVKFSLAIAKPCGSAKCSRQAAKLARRRSSFGAIAKSCGIGDCRMQPTDGKLAK